MGDIIIYTRPKIHAHKKGLLVGDPDKSDYGEYFWDLRNPPKDFNVGDRVYIATKGFIRGYFICDSFVRKWGQIGWLAESWIDIEPIPHKPFQGFKYANKVLELRRVEDENPTN